MKKAIVLVVLMVMGYSIQAQGVQITIGTATYSVTGSDYNLIWDDDNNGNSVVWLDYTNDVASWASQNTWASGLNGAGVLTYNLDPGYAITWNDDWRLPSTVDGTNVWGYDGTTAAGYNITTSEMGHLFYTELGNLGFYDTSGNLQYGYGLTNTGDFQNLTNSAYWSGTEWAANVGNAWNFNFYNGSQDTGGHGNPNYALAVRSGDVAAAAVPEPATIALLGIGLAGMAGYGVRRRRKRR